MSIRAAWTVFVKEILDIIRDRKTLIFMVLIPLIMMPGLMYLMQKFMIGSQAAIAAADSSVVIIGEEAAPTLVDYLTNQERTKFQPGEEQTDIDAFLMERRSGVNAFLNFRTDIDDEEQAITMLRDKQIDAVLVIPERFEERLQPLQSMEETAPVRYESDLSLRINFVSTVEHSENANDRLQKSLRHYREGIVAERLDTAGYDNSMIAPWENVGSDMATAQEIGGKILGSLLPYFIILITFMGGMYPAINLGAGEKEQKTLETLLASPAGRIELVVGKFLTIMITGIVSACLSIVGLWYGFTQVGSTASLRNIFALQLDPTTILFAVLLIVPLAILFAGILLAISVYARSYREAQGYMVPLSYVVIVPAFASFLPGVELNYTLSLVPVVNISLVLKEVLTGKIAEVLPFYGISIAGTLVLAVLAILFCASMFKKESAIFKI